MSLGTPLNKLFSKIKTKPLCLIHYIRIKLNLPHNISGKKSINY